MLGHIMSMTSVYELSMCVRQSGYTKGTIEQGRAPEDDEQRLHETPDERYPSGHSSVQRRMAGRKDARGHVEARDRVDADEQIRDAHAQHDRQERADDGEDERDGDRREHEQLCPLHCRSNLQYTHQHQPTDSSDARAHLAREMAAERAGRVSDALAPRAALRTEQRARDHGERPEARADEERDEQDKRPVEREAVDVAGLGEREPVVERVVALRLPRGVVQRREARARHRPIQRRDRRMCTERDAPVRLCHLRSGVDRFAQHVCFARSTWDIVGPWMAP